MNNKRKKWDKYFLEMCNTVAKNSTCFSRQIGAVLTRDNIVISTGYNGPARGIDPCDTRCINDYILMDLLVKKGIDPIEALNMKKCPRRILEYPSGEGLDLCNAVHAEKNCLLAAARNGVSTKDTIMYLNASISPCTQCFSALINAGVKEVVLIKNIPYDKTVEWLMKHEQLKIRKFDI